MKELLNLINGYKINDAKIKSITKEYFPMKEKYMIVVLLQYGNCGQNQTRLYLDAEMHEGLEQSKPVKEKLTGIDRQFKELEVSLMGSEFEDDNYNNMF